MSEAPDRIWLQDAGDYDRAHEVTWCATPIDDDDTGYTRDDLSAAREADARRDGWNAAIEAAANDIDCGCTDGVCGYPHACPKSDVAAILAMKETDQ